MAREIGQFWIGKFKFWGPRKYFIQKPYRENKSSCGFSKSQGIEYFDYDFVEISFVDELKPVKKFVNGHSYSEEYLDWLVNEAKKQDISMINVFVFNSGASCLETPGSAKGFGYNLHYMGEFEFENGID